MPETLVTNMLNRVESFGPEIKDWTVRVIGGAIFSDRLIDPREQGLLQELMRHELSQESINQIMRETFENHAPPPVPPIQIDPLLAIEIMECLLKICLCDNQLHSEEIRYLKEAALAMSIDEEKTHRMLQMAAFRVKSKFAHKLIHDLDAVKAHWLAGVILKLVGADGRIDPNEASFIMDVYHLTQNIQELTVKVKNDHDNLFLETLPAVQFEHEQALRILKYLLTIGMIDGNLDPAEQQVIEYVAHYLKVSRSELDVLMQSEKR